MANQEPRGKWAHVVGDQLIDDTGRVRDPSEIDANRLAEIVKDQISGASLPDPHIDVDRLRSDLTSRLSSLSTPNVDVDRLSRDVKRIPDTD